MINNYLFQGSFYDEHERPLSNSISFIITSCESILNHLGREQTSDEGVNDIIAGAPVHEVPRMPDRQSNAP
eukprot:6471878-Amphidinium_carterae.2